MGSRIKIDYERIIRFCHKWKIAEFSLFGSVLRNDFRSNSDIDVLVSFFDDADWSIIDFVDMREELKQIFGREVDFVEKDAIRNPFRRSSIMNNREVIYAA